LRSIETLPLAALLACVACGARDPKESVGQGMDALLNGTPSGPDDDAVVRVFGKALTATLGCTGTLAARNLVITAQHCVSNFNDGDFSCTNEGELVAGSRYGQMGMLLAPENVWVQVGSAPDRADPPAAFAARIFAPRTTTICKNDIAFVVLDRELDVTPTMVRFKRGILPGELARAVGYGETENGEIGIRYARAGVRIAQVGESPFRPVGDPTPPFTFVTQGPLLCIGDSGGPLFAESGALLGVFSRFAGSCSSPITRNIFTQAAPFASDVAEDAFQAAGATPILEPDPGSGGTAGMSTEEGGAAGAGGDDEGGAGAGGASAGSAGTAQAGSMAAGSSGAPGRRGLRQRGGCRCDVPGTEQDARTSSIWAAAALLASILRRRRGRLAGA
jgi:hypothetical protein